MSVHEHESRLFTLFTLQLPPPSRLPKLVIFCCHWLAADQLWLGADLAPTLPSLLAHLEQALRTVGVPRTLYVRAVKPLTVNHQQWALPFAHLCAWAGCTPRAADKQHATYGRTTVQDVLLATSGASLEECRHALVAAALDYNRRHAVEGAQPFFRQPPQQPYIYRELVPCRVLVDGFIRFQNCFYSVPRRQAGHTVWVHREDDQVSIESASGKVLASHPAARFPAEVRMNLDHFVQTRRDPELSHLYNAFLHVFPKDELFLACLLAQRRFHAAETLQAILRATRVHSPQTLRTMFHRCWLYNNFSYPFMIGLLEPTDPLPVPQPRLETGRLF